MEPASRDPQVRVAAVPMPLRWLDVGSWPSYAETRPRKAAQNVLAAGNYLVRDSHRCLVASSDASHLLVVAGCEDLLVIHTPDATLVCPVTHAEQIKDIQKQVTKEFNQQFI